MDTIRQTKLIVDTKCIRHNIKEIQKFVGNNVEIMPVIKARAYGTGVGTMPEIFTDLGVKILAVAVVDEGIALRNRGFEGDIFILNQPLVEEIKMILQYNLITSVCEVNFIKLLNKTAKNLNTKASIHLEVDTGMGRTGIKLKDCNNYVEMLKTLNNVRVEGIFTHFSSSDSDLNYTKNQINIFNEVLNIMEQEFDFKYIHACNTGGIINFPESHYNLVRPGISIYGHFPNENLKDKLNLLPATKLKTKISFIHDINKGDSVSYDRSFIAERPTKVAVIPIGYADGIMRSYKGSVAINGELADIIGVINMDSFMVDITNLKNVDIEDDVFIWDNDIITLEDVAKKSNTITYEILVRLAPRVVKDFI